MDPSTPPTSLDLKKDTGLTIQWADGSTSYYPIAHLRRMSPSADQKQLRDEMQTNPLTILNPRGETTTGPLVATEAELVGNYALRISFSDGHSAGIYSWTYLHEIDPIHTTPSEPGTSVPVSDSEPGTSVPGSHQATDTPTPD